MNYGKWEEEGKKTIVRAALKKFASKESDAVGNLLIQFRTGFPGVSLPPAMREEYPEDMTISLSDSFWNLHVDDDAFSVDLLFDNAKKRLRVPFDALIMFNDVDAKFSIEFDWGNALIPVTGDNILLFEDIQRAFAST